MQRGRDMQRGREMQRGRIGRGVGIGTTAALLLRRL